MGDRKFHEKRHFSSTGFITHAPHNVPRWYSPNKPIKTCIYLSSLWIRKKQWSSTAPCQLKQIQSNWQSLLSNKFGHNVLFQEELKYKLFFSHREESPIWFFYHIEYSPRCFSFFPSPMTPKTFISTSQYQDHNHQEKQPHTHTPIQQSTPYEKKYDHVNTYTYTTTTISRAHPWHLLLHFQYHH